MEYKRPGLGFEPRSWDPQSQGIPLPHPGCVLYDYLLINYNIRLDKILLIRYWS